MKVTSAVPLCETSMSSTVPTRDAGHAHLAALDELAGVDELGGDAVAAAAGEQQDDDGHGDEHDQAGDERAHGR